MLKPIFLAFFLAVPLAVSADQLSPSETNDLVKRVQAVHQSDPSLQADFHEERRMAMLKDPVVSDGKIYVTLPDKIRREITRPTPSTTVIDGRKMTIYYPNFKQAEVYDLEKRPVLKGSIEALTAGLNFRDISTYYNIDASKEGNQYRVTLTPKTTSIRKLVRSVTLTLDSNLNPRVVDFESARGEKVRIAYNNVKREALPASEFDFRPPAGTNITTPLGS